MTTTATQLQRRPGFLGPVLYKVFVNGIAYNNVPPLLDVSLNEIFGQHDLFTFRIEYQPNFQVNQLTVWPNNTPISVQWGQSPDLNWWYGYVNHHAVNSNADSGSKLLQITYTCIGTSSVLNSVQVNKWEQVTPTYVAKTIAAKNGFRSVTNPSSWLLPYEQQAAMSDFQFLSYLANKCGMRFWCSGGTLYMINPTTALEGGGQSTVPVFYSDKALNYADTCRDLNYLQGTNLPGSIQANRTLYAIDSATGQAFSATAPATVPTTRVAVKTTTSTTNYADASNRVNAWAALSQFWIGATATLYGNTHLYPGKVVHLVGAALPSNAAGFWLITSATHSLTSSGLASPELDSFLTEVIMMKNTDASSVTLSNITPVIPEMITCVLNKGGNWVASNLSAVSVS